MLRDGDDEVSERSGASRRPVVPWLYGVVALVGSVLLFVGDPNDDFGVIALLFALPYLVWWAALERVSATPRLTVARRAAACAFVSLLLAFVQATVIVAVCDAFGGDSDSPAFLVSGALLLLGGVVGSAAWCWRILGEQAPLAGARRLLRVITGAAAGAVVFHLLAAMIAQSRGTMLAGLLAASATAGAALVLGWTVLPWVRSRWLAVRTPFVDD